MTPWRLRRRPIALDRRSADRADPDLVGLSIRSRAAQAEMRCPDGTFGPATRPSTDRIIVELRHLGVVTSSPTAPGVRLRVRGEGSRG